MHDLIDSLRARREPHATRVLALALQGGGSFGAFTWGVLDRLLEGDFHFDMVSGASAGAVNAVLLADGLAEGGPEAARARLERFWRRVSDAGSPLRAPALLGSVMGPYLLNPLDHNPLRTILDEEVDFERLQAASPVRLLIAATRVRDGSPRLFREHEITRDAVLASACLPMLNQAIEIDGEAYWDGGFSANPPLRQLAEECEAEDIVLVQLLPDHDPEPVQSGRDIARRTARMTFNGPLRKELEGLSDLVALSRNEVIPSARGRKLRRLRLHRLAAAEAVPDLHRASPIDVSWPFLTRLRDAGRGAASEWLAWPGEGGAPG
jgi:NTE family protein